MIKRVFAVISVGILFFACQKNDEEADKNAITNLIKKDSVWFNANTEVDSTDNSGSFLMMGDTATAVIWWRTKQTHPDTNITINVVNDSAFVEWERTNQGELVIIAYTPSDSAWHTWRKELFETARLNAIFMRTGNPSDEDRGWELYKISCAWANSDDNTVFIDSVKIESESNGTILIVDPANTFYNVDSLITFNSGEELKVTLYTHGSDAEAFLHTFVLVFPFYLRVKFKKEGDGIFTGTWKAQIIPFPRYAIFDLLNHNTLYEEETPYDFNGWLFPYNIKK